MKSLRIFWLAAVMLSLFAASTRAQAVKQQDLASAWDTMTNMFVTTAKAMPAENFTYQPTAEIATFGGLVGHTVHANYMFGSTVNAPKVPRPEFDEASKDEVVKNLEASFKYIKDAINKLKDENMNDEIDWFGSKMSRLKAILTMTDHIEREYGKVITYTRLKGVTPAAGRGW